MLRTLRRGVGLAALYHTNRSYASTTMLPTQLPVLVLPGFGGSGPEHWQGLWAKEAGYTYVEQSSWEEPKLEAWMANLKAAIAASSVPPVLLCHSLGTILTAHYLANAATCGTIAGAFLVAPPADMETEVIMSLPLDTFRPMPLQELGVPVTLVMSPDDPYSTVEKTEKVGACSLPTLNAAHQAIT